MKTPVWIPRNESQFDLGWFSSPISTALVGNVFKPFLNSKSVQTSLALLELFLSLLIFELLVNLPCVSPGVCGYPGWGGFLRWKKKGVKNQLWRSTWPVWKEAVQMCCNILPSPEQTWLNRLCLLPTITEFARAPCKSQLVPSWERSFSVCAQMFELFGISSLWGLLKNFNFFEQHLSLHFHLLDFWIPWKQLFVQPKAGLALCGNKLRKPNAVYSWPQELCCPCHSQKEPENLCSDFVFMWTLLSGSLELCSDRMQTEAYALHLMAGAAFCIINKRRSREITN